MMIAVSIVIVNTVMPAARPDHTRNQRNAMKTRPLMLTQSTQNESSSDLH